MFAFVIVYFSVLLSIICTIVNSKIVKLIVLSIVTLILISVVGLRSEDVGVDTSSYYRIFYDINGWLDPRYFSWEPGFIFINQLVYWLHGNAEHAILVFSTINMIFIVAFLNKSSSNIALSLILFIGLAYYFLAFNIVRQSLAMSIICFSFSYLYEKKYITWGLYFLLALSFHFSAVIFLLYFVSKIKKINHFVLLGWLISLIFIINPNLIGQVINIFSFLVPSKYSTYTQLLDNSQSLRLRMLLSQIFFLLFYYSYRKMPSSFEKQVLIISLYGVIFSNILTFSGYIARIAHYFSIFQIIALPIVINYLFKGRTRYFVNIILFIFISIFYFRSVLISSHGQYPYSTWLTIF